MADASNGEVEIQLDGKSVTLRCTPEVAKKVSFLVGGNGYQGVLARLGMLDFDTYVAVVAFATGKKPVDVEEKVYRRGVVNLTAELTLFVTYLANGGRPVEAAKDGDEPGEA